MKIPLDEYERIAAEIHSPDSPVGIDAKKTHVLILHRLERIEACLQRLKEQLDEAR